MKAGTSIADVHPVTIVRCVQPDDEWRLQEEETELMSVSQSKEIPAFVQNLIHNVHDSLPQSTRQVLTNVLVRHQGVFSQSEG